MLARTVLKEAFGRVAEELPATLEGLTPEQVLWRPGPEANSIGWLAWHIARCEDAQMAPLRAHASAGAMDEAAAMAASAAMLEPLGATGVAGMTGIAGAMAAQASIEAAESLDPEEGEPADVWSTQGWHERFGLPYGRDEIGYGHSSEQVGAFTVTDTGLLTGYYAAVHAATLEILDRLEEPDFERIVDTNWDPHVTLGVRVVSVLNDITAHQGQIAYVRGLLLN